jgi:hypothetical protein
VVRIEDVLGARLREAGQRARVIHPARTGGNGLLQPPGGAMDRRDYLTLRPAFSQPGAVFAYGTEIFWDDERGHLGFAEIERVDNVFTQRGFVSMPNLSGHTYLITSEEGQYRMIMLGRATRERRMYGLLSTLQVGSGSQLLPVSCPIALIPTGEMTGLRYGLLEPGDADFGLYRDALDRAVTAEFCRWHG